MHGRTIGEVAAVVAVAAAVVVGTELISARAGQARVTASPPAAPPPAPAASGDTPPWTPPQPPGAKERIEERGSMVRRQMARPLDGREAIRSEIVLEAMRTVPRHAFVPETLRRHAYEDTPLPIGHGQTISQPYIVAFMTELLDLRPGQKVLEIGTGSGYQAAVLAQLTPEVYTIEIIEALADGAARALRDQGYVRVGTKHADGYHGWPEHAPFDAIIVTAAAPFVPEPLKQQLRDGGRLILPVGDDAQELVVVTRRGEAFVERRVLPVRFVPMTGKVRQ
jgi:protein-L-isoaspartate(D-aspartate) O-methyltransferase